MGFPTTSHSPLAWKSYNFYDEEWVTTLIVGDIEEIEQAADRFKVSFGVLPFDLSPLLSCAELQSSRPAFGPRLSGYISTSMPRYETSGTFSRYAQQT
jgi:hypothetical protein